MALIQKTKWLPSSLLRERPEKAYLPRHRARTAGKLVCLAPSAWNRIWGLVLAVEGVGSPLLSGAEHDHREGAHCVRPRPCPLPGRPPEQRHRDPLRPSLRLRPLSRPPAGSRWVTGHPGSDLRGTARWSFTVAAPFSFPPASDKGGSPSPPHPAQRAVFCFRRRRGHPEQGGCSPSSDSRFPRRSWRGHLLTACRQEHFLLGEGRPGPFGGFSVACRLCPSDGGFFPRLASPFSTSPRCYSLGTWLSLATGRVGCGDDGLLPLSAHDLCRVVGTIPVWTWRPPRPSRHGAALLVSAAAAGDVCPAKPGPASLAPATALP